MIINRKTLIALTLLLISTPALAYDEAVWDAIARRPDVEIKTEDGQRVAYFKGGVTIYEDGEEEDTSGYGAVRCNWNLYIGIKAMLEACTPGTTSAHIEYAIEKTKPFIIANSLTPITATELDAEMTKKLEEFKTGLAGASEEKHYEICDGNPLMNIEKSFTAIPLEEFKTYTDLGLAVPRPPVSKPCM